MENIEDTINNVDDKYLLENLIKLRKHENMSDEEYDSLKKHLTDIIMRRYIMLYIAAPKHMSEKYRIDIRFAKSTLLTLNLFYDSDNGKYIEFQYNDDEHAQYSSWIIPQQDILSWFTMTEDMAIAKFKYIEYDNTSSAVTDKLDELRKELRRTEEELKIIEDKKKTCISDYVVANIENCVNTESDVSSIVAECTNNGN